MESSRIFVRGLPPKFTDDDVRKHFGKFPITDIKYFPARHIGYVGYKSPQDASKAVSYFNKTFIRMSRINVEMAKPIADKELHFSRRELKAQKNQPRSDDYYPPPRDNNLKRKRDEVEQDPKLKEYLEVMQPRSKTNVWANDDAQIEVTAPPVASPEDAVEIPAGESDDEYQVIPKKTKTAQPKPQIEEPGVIDIPMVDRTGEQEPAVTEQATENAEDGTDAAQATLTDADWLRSRTNRVLDLVEDDEDESHLEAPPQPRPISQHVPHPKGDEAAEKTNNEQVEDAAPDLTEEDKIRETGRLYLRNLSYEVSQEDLQERFSKYGVLDEVHVPSKRTDGKGKGFAFVQFSDPENAVAAYQENDGTIFQGRLLHILSGKAKRNDELDEFAISKLPLKKQREVLRKKNAGAHSFNWNSLYLNTDAVISAVAQRLNISKAELLDHTSSDAAVKQAQAETHVIQETKNYFAQHGVDLEAFKKSSKGDLAILVKNIPHGVSAAEVKKLFEEHGDVKRFLYPPLGLTAIVELANATQAKTAFAALSYRKMKDSILYLEKAPKDLFKEGAVAPAIPTSSSDKIGAKLSAADLLEDEPKPDATNVATLHVKNLNFSTTTQKLTETFSPLAGFRSAVVRSKIDPKRGVLSLGYGFVEFNSAEAASAALRAMDGHNLEGHALKIQASHRGADAAEERRREDAVKKAPGTKILIKNLPFEATKKDIRALFAPYGALRSVRVPKKFDSSSRGFGFAEYSTQRDATNAMNALKNTHLLGRRLVLTFAETEGDDPEAELEKMQQKVGSQANKVALQRLTSGGRKKFNVTGTDDLDDA